MFQGLRTWSKHPIFQFQTGMLRGNRGFKGPQTGSLRGILVCRGSISGLLRSDPVCRGQNVGLLWSKPVCRTFLRVSLRSIRPWRRFLGQSLVSFWDRSPLARSVTLTRRGSLAPIFSRSCVETRGSPPIAASRRDCPELTAVSAARKLRDRNRCAGSIHRAVRARRCGLP